MADKNDGDETSTGGTGTGAAEPVFWAKLNQMTSDLNPLIDNELTEEWVFPLPSTSPAATATHTYDDETDPSFLTFDDEIKVKYSTKADSSCDIDIKDLIKPECVPVELEVNANKFLGEFRNRDFRWDAAFDDFESSTDESTTAAIDIDDNSQASNSSKSSESPRIPCYLCDVTFSSNYSKFLHDETIHNEGQTDESTVEGSFRLYSRICGKSSRIPAVLRTHNEYYHPPHMNQYLCLFCDEVFPRKIFLSSELLQAHQVIHTSQPPFTCKLCEDNQLQENLLGQIVFESPADLDNHLRRVHFHDIFFLWSRTQNKLPGYECMNDDRNIGQTLPNINTKSKPNLFCRFCNSLKSSVYDVKQHERNNHGEKFIYRCSQMDCGKSFAEMDEMLTCEETHKSKNNNECKEQFFKCMVCKGRFANCDILKDHFEMKHYVGGAKCKDCGSFFRSQGQRDIHVMKYHGVGLKACLEGQGQQLSICTWKFKKTGNDNRRNIASCKECGKRYSSTAARNRHMKTAHLKQFTKICGLCGKGFMDAYSLRRHSGTKHSIGKRFKCHICSDGFNDKNRLQEHLESHKRQGTWKESTE